MNYDYMRTEAHQMSRDWPLERPRGRKVKCPDCGKSGYVGGLWVLSHKQHALAPCGRLFTARGINSHRARCGECKIHDGRAVMYDPVMTDTPAPLQPFDPQQAVFTSLAFWVSERDGITPAEAAVNLGNLFASEPVVAEAEAAEAEAAAEAAKPQAAAEAADAIAAILEDLRRVLGL